MDDERVLPFIIRSKLYRPRVHRVHVLRQQLIDRLDQRFRRPLTLISAPAGYGKTTLASSWLESIDSPSAWLSVDETENDLRSFLSYFLAAIQTIFPNIGRQTMALLNTSTLAPVKYIAGSLINEIDLIEQSFIMALDDFHRIRDKSVLELLDHLLRHPPRSMNLMLIGRRDPALPISTLRARRLISEIRTQDLCFNEAEINEFLTQMLGNQVDSTTSAALAQKTEGWVTGLVLAAFSMRNQGYIEPKLLEPHIDAKFVMEYLFIEVFSQQPSEIIRYLETSAILDRFCGPLCEAVSVTNNDQSMSKISGWEFISWLVKQDLFLIPLDNEHLWFRYHHLFQKFLRRHLNREFSRNTIDSLHQRAGVWFAENGLIDEALHHFLATGDALSAIQLIEQHRHVLMNQEKFHYLARWMSMLPRNSVENNPLFLISEAWLKRSMPELSEILARLELSDYLQQQESSATKELRGEVAALRSMLYYRSLDSENALTSAKQALNYLSPEKSYARHFARVYLARSHQMRGDPNSAHLYLNDAMKKTDSRKEHAQLLLIQLSLYWLEANLSELIQKSSQLLSIAKKEDLIECLIYAQFHLGIGHFERNELEAAESYLVQILETPYFITLQPTPEGFTHSAFALSLTLQSLGQADRAYKIAIQIARHTMETQHLSMHDLASSFQAELALFQDRTDEAIHWALGFDPEPFGSAIRFYIPQLTLAKVYLEQNTRETIEEANTLLGQLENIYAKTHNRRALIYVLALKALVYDAQGDETAALSALEQTVALAEPGGFIRLFVDMGPPMADLMQQLHKKEIAVDYIKKILTAFEQEYEQRATPEKTEQPIVFTRQPQRPYPPSQPLVEPLTNRELDVLELLALRLSNDEVAEKLFISVATVKSHLKNIYQKLNVSKRRQAVEKATKIGILSGGK